MRDCRGAHGLLKALADCRLCFVVASGNATGDDQDKIRVEAGGGPLAGHRGLGLGGDQGQEEEEEVEHDAGNL